MKIEISGGKARFRDGNRLAGEWVLDDPFKPYAHPLNTPKGHSVSLAMPGDHRHHKGLMYALHCEDLNFWEEPAGEEMSGIQKVESCHVEAGALVVELRWQRLDGEWPTYRETRRLSCNATPDGLSYVWDWQSKRIALRPHRLVKSPWSKPDGRGRTVNYHGLGIRLPWMWAFPSEKCGGVEIEGRPASLEAAHGSTARSVGFSGLFDGYWTPPAGAITIEQSMGFGWFVLRAPIPYLAVGPTTLDEIEVRTGQEFHETYTLRVEDREIVTPP
jgi:hypothetical protein